jgi:lipoyl-dependent peroxiredoxin
MSVTNVSGRLNQIRFETLALMLHASCFTMALAAQLNQAGLNPEKLQTSAAVTLEKDGEGFAITAVHPDLVARIPGANGAALSQRPACKGRLHVSGL